MRVFEKPDLTGFIVLYTKEPPDISDAEVAAIHGWKPGDYIVLHQWRLTDVMEPLRREPSEWWTQDIWSIERIEGEFIHGYRLKWRSCKVSVWTATNTKQANRLTKIPVYRFAMWRSATATEVPDANAGTV